MNASILHDGRRILSDIKTSSNLDSEIKDKLWSYEFQPNHTEDLQSWFVCIVAFKALIEGNFGVGSALFDINGRLIEFSGNQVFLPSFRSDGHAEMMVLTNFEQRQNCRIDLSTFTLFTSLESCPMCCVRLSSAQVGTVLHVSDDDHGGMTRKQDLLPPIWRELQSTVQFRRASCSEELRDMSREIFMSNVTELTSALIGKNQPLRVGRVY